MAKAKYPGGFTLIPKWVIVSGIKNHSLIVYNALAFYADNDTRTCYPSVQQLMSISGYCDDKTVRCAIKDLEDHGCIVVLRRRGTSSRYYLPSDPPEREGEGE